MTDHDEQLARIAARLSPEPPPWPDQREENARLQAANENLNHRVLCLQHENRGLYAKLELMRAGAQEGEPNQSAASFVSLELDAKSELQNREPQDSL